MFKRVRKPDVNGFYATGISASSLMMEEMVRVKINGRVIVLARSIEGVMAFDDFCPHGAASLSKGSLRNHRVCCPEHGYCFDIQSGQISWPEDEHYRLRVHTVMVEDGQIKLRLEGNG